MLWPEATCDVLVWVARDGNRKVTRERVMAKSGRVVGVIPARLQSTRLPRKLLLDETGCVLLEYAWAAACRASRLDEVIVATDSLEIVSAVEAFGGRAVMTGEHSSGTDRVAEVVARCCADAVTIVNVQGDEPELDPDHIDSLVEVLETDSTLQMATLACPIRDRRTLDDPSCVKVVTGSDGRALYFSRHPIPCVRDGDLDALLEGESPWLLHVGLYAYRRDYLLELTSLPASPLEALECLEQLRALQHGAAIGVRVAEHSAVGIDTPDDYARFVARAPKARVRGGRAA
jgi:3-deoxy-manno-octulosonate cytidylyltransferase (CMP-KDO synthetase)